MLDAEFKSEERFSKLSIAFEDSEEKSRVISEADKIIAKHSLKPETYITKVSNGKEVLVIEYQDDVARECGAIFEEIIKVLNIKDFL
jgi:endo-alpha-1,4-polygalactosaminidase (GH114 family)